MRSGNHKGFQLSEATPVKRERHEFQFDSAHTSSGKGDAAFQLYCQQNLSPLNNFAFGKSTFLHSPGLQPTKNFGKSKSVFSPGFHHMHNNNNNKYNQIPPHHQYPTGQQMRAASVDHYPILSKDEFDVDYQQNLMKGAGTPMGGNKYHVTPVPGRIFPYQNQMIPSSKSFLPPSATKKDKEKIGGPQDYIFQSPVFKISFNGREQLDLFLESGAMDKDQIEHISFVGSSNKVVVSKQSQLEYENSQNSYQRVIQFNDENEEDQQEQGQQDDNCEDNNQQVTNDRQSSRDFKAISTKGVIQRNLLGNVSEESGRMKSLNLFEEAPSQLGAYDSQMTFNPYVNYHDSSTTTVKKPIIESSQQISSQQDLKLTATKANGNQKRKLFASPSIKDDRDLHTPSTKKKKTPSSALHIAAALSNNTCQTSNFMNQDEKSQDKIITEKQKQEDKENQDNKQIPTPFSLQASSSAIKICEEKKICCNCKRTKCLKLYCECFAASRVCEGCSCQGCFNKPEFEQMRKEARNSILERDRSAFDPKIEAGPKTQTLESEEGNLESDQKAHSKGCNCKKSNCLKKYCECFQLGVKCSKLCKCESCKNTTSSVYSDDGDYQMSASAIKNSARKQLGHGSMNEYSQYNQFNYFHPDPYYPYYYPNYPYGAYPYFGDYYMCHPEEAEKHQGNHIEPYPYDQIQNKGVSKSNKKQQMIQQQLMIMNGKKGQIKGKIQPDDGFYSHFPAPPLDKKRKIMQTKEDNEEISNQREEEIEEEEDNIDKKCSEEQIEEKEDKNAKQKDKENNNNKTSEEEMEEENEIKSKNSIKEELTIDNSAEKTQIKTKQTKNLENQSKLNIEKEIDNGQIKEEICCQEQDNEEEKSIKGKKQPEEKQGSNQKSKKNTDLPKRELSKRGSGQKEVQHQILTRRNQESNKKKKSKTQQQVNSSDESGQEEGQEEQLQVEVHQDSAKKEENRIITRHSEEKLKQTVSSNSRPRRNK